MAFQQQAFVIFRYYEACIEAFNSIKEETTAE